MITTYSEVVIGKPVLDSWHLFCHDELEWEEFKKTVLFTDERYLPAVLVQCGVAKSEAEVKKNKPDLDRTLDKPDFVVVKYGKRYVAIQVGE